MSIINDYSVKIIADQRQHEYQTAAANERLARIARGDRPVWWRRLLDRPAAPVAASASARTRQGQPTLRQHPVTH
jgi:hypothetical protein